MRRTLALPLLMLGAACARTVTPDTSRFIAPTGSTADVYRTVLDSLGGVLPPGPMMVVESTVVFQAPAGVPVAWEEFANVPAGLPARLESVSRTPEPITRLPLPRATIVLTRTEAEEIRRVDPRAWWTEFQRRYPAQRAIFAFSPVAFAQDSSAALVEMVTTCGDSCGGGQLVWVERRAGSWKVRRVYSLWVN